jgi:hypothetical protein
VEYIYLCISVNLYNCMPVCPSNPVLEGPAGRGKRSPMNIEGE